MTSAQRQPLFFMPQYVVFIMLLLCTHISEKLLWRLVLSWETVAFDISTHSQVTAQCMDSATVQLSREQSMKNSAWLSDCRNQVQVGVIHKRQMIFRKRSQGEENLLDFWCDCTTGNFLFTVKRNLQICFMYSTFIAREATWLITIPGEIQSLAVTFVFTLLICFELRTCSKTCPFVCAFPYS